MNLADRWVLITGASSGFGAAAAVAFGAQRARLLLGARRVDRMSEVAGLSLKAGAAGTHFHALDVSRPESVAAFADWVKKITGRVDVLINNAGGAHGLDPVATATDADWETTFETNVLGLLRVTRAILPLMPRNEGATILSLGSIAGHTAYAGAAAYCAAKAGVSQISRSLRQELLGHGIRVGTVDPGFAETEFATVRFKGDATRARSVYEGMTPLTAEDVAETLVWVAGRPPHVNIDEIIIQPVDQANIYKIHRKATKPGSGH